MARSAAAAARPARDRSGHRSAANGSARKPSRRISDGKRKPSAARKPAAAARKPSAPRKPAAARKPSPTRPSPVRKATPPRQPSPIRGATVTAGAVALPLPLRVAQAPFARALRSRGSGVLDALLHGGGWIALVGVLLAGIVFFNVDLLKLNRDIAATAQHAGGVARENARLRLELARLDSSERIQRAAAAQGLLLPAPGDVRYLRSRPLLDARLAAKRVGEEAAAPGPAAPITPAPVPTQAPVPPAAPGPTPAPAAAPAAPVAQPAPAPAPQPAPQPQVGSTPTGSPAG